jgi:hypothetical protein
MAPKPKSAGRHERQVEPLAQAGEFVFERFGHPPRLGGDVLQRAGQRQWLALTCTSDARQAEQELAPIGFEKLMADTLDWRQLG